MTLEKLMFKDFTLPSEPGKLWGVWYRGFGQRWSTSYGGMHEDV